MTQRSDYSDELPVEDDGELILYIDEFLRSISGQSLVDSDAVQNFLLDLRNVVEHNLKKKEVDNE